MSQSSTIFNSIAAHAVDGDTNGNWNAGSVSHTAAEAGAWWEVDLGAVMDIERIDLWNRTDCCGGRLKNYFVLVSDSPHPEPGGSGVTEYFEAARAGSPTSVSAFVQGRYVRVLLTQTSPLALAEVQVWGSGIPIPLANLSTGRPAVQSSTKHGGNASRAVDGDTNGEWSGGSVTHTGTDAEAWWEVDLGAQMQIELVELWNRTDCCGGRLRYYWILISSEPNPVPGAPGVTQYFESSRGGTPTAVPFLVMGRYVRIQKAVAGPLSLAEVVVSGHGALPAVVNGAVGRPASQSSTAAGARASRAVDDSTDGDFANGSVTHTTSDLDAWWEVDLGSPRQIEWIDIWNRTDCCGSRLSSYYVLVSDSPSPQPGAAAFEQFEASQAGTPTAVSVGLIGRYVRIQKTGQGPLSLAEVQVWVQQ